MTITLRDINKDNWEAASKLTVSDDQKAFVSPNWYSMLQVIHLDVDIYDKGIYLDDEMVGYAMMGQDPDDKTCFVGRLMIDQQHQGKGYGRAAMLAIIDDIKARYNTDAIFIRFVPENLGARKLYESLGFMDTGEVNRGELVYRLTLS